MSNPITQQRYLALPDSLHSTALPADFPAAKLLVLNDGLLKSLKLQADWFRSADGLAALSGSQNPQTTLAMAYAGHQFGGYSPLLGDGRAHMLGQLQAADGSLLDVQLKGSGRTPYSRGGDGKATLSSALREYLVSEAMAGLGIPSTRSLAVIGTGELVMREQTQAGGIVARTAQSHIRVGTFQYAANNLDQDELQALADFVIEHHFPKLEQQGDKRYSALIEAVAARQASLVAQWMLVGFIHGVMNTDNASVVGETIDFGPCAFMDEFNPAKVFSSIDRQGRYAWNEQGSIAYWNLARFAESLLPLLDDDKDKAVSIAENALKPYEGQFRDAFVGGFQKKLGIDVSAEKAQALIEKTVPALAKDQIDFTVFFDHLNVATDGDETPLRSLFSVEAEATAWLASWQELREAGSCSSDAMRRANPALIARNHRVEEALEAAAERNDWAPFERLSKALENPYKISETDIDLQEPPQVQERVTQTFCGT